MSEYQFVDSLFRAYVQRSDEDIAMNDVMQDIINESQPFNFSKSTHKPKTKTYSDRVYQNTVIEQQRQSEEQARQSLQQATNEAKIPNHLKPLVAYLIDNDNALNFDAPLSETDKLHLTIMVEELRDHGIDIDGINGQDKQSKALPTVDEIQAWIKDDNDELNDMDLGHDEELKMDVLETPQQPVKVAITAHNDIRTAPTPPQDIEVIVTEHNDKGLPSLPNTFEQFLINVKQVVISIRDYFNPPPPPILEGLPQETIKAIEKTPISHDLAFDDLLLRMDPVGSDQLISNTGMNPVVQQDVSSDSQQSLLNIHLDEQVEQESKSSLSLS